MRGDYIRVLSSIIGFVFFSIPALTQVQSETMISKFFPDPQVEINTPGFGKSEGFINYDEMMDFLHQLIQKHNDILSVSYCGQSELGKKIPVVYLGNSDKDLKIKIWMQGGLHGNEPSGTEGLLMFIDYLVKNKNINSILNDVHFAFIPMANIDGYEKQVRRNENRADLNRDQVTLLEQESVFLKQAFSDYSPTIAIDFHEYRPIRKDIDELSTGKTSISQDVLFLPSGNLNIPKPIRKIIDELYLQNLKLEFNEHEITYHDYFQVLSAESGSKYLKMGGSRPRSSATSYGLTNAISILIEIRGIGLERDSYKRRVYSGFLVARSFLETTLKNKAKVIKTVKTSIKQTIKRANPIVLNSFPGIYYEKMRFINMDANEDTLINIEIEDHGRLSNPVIRKRPKAYILLPAQHEIAQKLKVLGIEMDTLKSAMSFKTEVFRLENNYPTLDSNPESSIKITKELRQFPRGSFVITTAQKNANLIVSVLEPEMENGYYKYRMITEKDNGEIPIYRCISNIKKAKN